ncbi:MAG: hypothetical protein JSW41_04875 [Candidatus Aenigmatarchaeota archaeon]|nr:MAG: hypothetical protein JSW41_04875 [Candidatus Aenigmarchaeota archaeon]
MNTQQEILDQIKLVVHSVSGPLNIKRLAKALKLSHQTTSKYAQISAALGEIRIEKVGLNKMLLKV